MSSASRTPRPLDAIAPPTSVALRRGPGGFFVDFDLLPALLRRADRLNGREEAQADWSTFLTETGYNSDFLDLGDDGPHAASRIASDAWRLASLTGLLTDGGLTEAGRWIVNGQDDLTATLAEGIGKHLVGRGRTEIVPLLQAGAARLGETDHVWARLCPGLLPVEMGSIVHWACVNERKCSNLMDSLATWRDVAMHRRGEPDARLSESENAGIHFDTVVDFYLSHPWLAERTPMPYGEELAMARLMDFAGLLVEKPLGRFMCYLAPVA